MLIKTNYRGVTIIKEGDRTDAKNEYLKKAQKGIFLSIHHSPVDLLRTVDIENSIIVSDLLTMDFLKSI